MDWALGNLLPVISVATIDGCPLRHVLKGRGLPLRACAHAVQGRASLAPLPLCVAALALLAAFDAGHQSKTVRHPVIASRLHLFCLLCCSVVF